MASLSPEELAAERRAFHERRAAEFERATGVRPEEKQHKPLRQFIVGNGKADTRPKRWRLCPCGEEFLVTHGHQRWCPACRADYVKDPNRRYKKHGRPQ